jgi:cytochrome c553
MFQTKQAGRHQDRRARTIGRVNMTKTRFATAFGALVGMAALAAPAIAAEGHGHAVEVPAVATPGNTAESTAFLNAKMLVCNTCHGDNGVPRNTATPVIWGQQENYLLKQMHDFQSGSRDAEVMTWMATALTPAETGAAASFFAKKDWPAKSTNVAAASPPAMVAVCQACHQQNLTGGLPAPRLAGQKYEYLVEAMRRYADGERTNNPEMMSMMKALSPAERETMARYISGL